MNAEDTAGRLPPDEGCSTDSILTAVWAGDSLTELLDELTWLWTER